MLNIFISYSTKDIDHVNKVQAYLGQFGKEINIFKADKSIAPGEYLIEEISKAIRQCDLFILFWSENAEKSKWVPAEIGKAHSLNKDIIPLVLTKNLRLPPLLSGIKYISLHNNYTNGLNWLIKLVHNKLHSNGFLGKKAAIAGGITGAVTGAAFFLFKKFLNKKTANNRMKK